MFKDALQAYKGGPETFSSYADTLRGMTETDRKRWEAKKTSKEEFVPRVHVAKVKVVGCWDTVASLGVPWQPLTNAGGVSGDRKHFDGSLVEGQGTLLA